MKKKLLAGFLGLLMILTMATGAFARVIIPNHSDTNTSAPTPVIPDYCPIIPEYRPIVPDYCPIFPEYRPPYVDSSLSQAMYDECLKCDYDYAIFYIHEGDVKYYCPDCKASGIALKAERNCFCGEACDCLLACSCGAKISVMCGDTCGACGKKLVCTYPCKSCTEHKFCSYYCGDTCKCILKCEKCEKFGFCGSTCTKCGTKYACEKDCYGCLKDYYYTYKVSVSSSYGGEFYLTDGFYGFKGEEKKLYIYAKDGYVLSDVVINGFSYGNSRNVFTLDMDQNYYVRIVFKREVPTKTFTVTASAIGNGTITVKKNDTIISSNSVTATYADSLIYVFTPAKNYTLADVIVNGKSVGAKPSYAISRLTKDTTIQVVFAWDSPFTDVAAKHAPAVEFVTEAGIMTSFYSSIHTDLFLGDKLVSIRSFAAALAELADTADALETSNDRIKWAIANGIVAEDAKITEQITAKVACEIMAKYLDVLEDKNDITFIGNKDSYSALETCIALNLMSESTYNANAKVTRYDLAEYCYAIASLDYAD